MNQEWINWARHNLKRGCDPSTLKSTLKDNGFSEGEIELALTPEKVSSIQKIKEWFLSILDEAKNNQEKDKSQIAQTDVDYLKLTQLAITQNETVREIANEHIQLFVLDNFLSGSECKSLISQINKNLRPSTITNSQNNSLFRTSRTCDLGLSSNKIIRKVDAKIARTIGIPLDWSETIQGQKYTSGQEFKAHTDYFEPGSKEFKEYADTLGQRTWTFMVYLNSPQDGGETCFTAIDKCFKPQTGQALIWNNLQPDGKPNSFTIHHARPVIQGTKLVITKWFRDKGKGDEFKIEGIN